MERLGRPPKCEHYQSRRLIREISPRRTRERGLLDLVPTPPSNKSYEWRNTTRPRPYHRQVRRQEDERQENLWVTIFRCFHCGKHGHNLRRCSQCAQAYYCDADRQRKHWRKHRPVCRAAVAALARRATRERLARAVREEGVVNAEGAEEDTLCVICQAKPVDPVEGARGV